MKRTRRICNECGKYINGISEETLEYFKYTGEWYHIRHVPKKLNDPDDLISLIINTVCEFFRINKSDIITKNRKKEVVKCRRFIFLFCIKYGLKLNDIERYKGGVIHGFNHANALFHRNKAEFFINTYTDYTFVYDMLMPILDQKVADYRKQKELYLKNYKNNTDVD